jgi:hypothetical protein
VILLGFLVFGIGLLSEFHTKQIVQERFDFFEGRLLKVKVQNFLRGDFEIRVDESSLSWTFNRFTGEMISWNTSSEDLKKTEDPKKGELKKGDSKKKRKSKNFLFQRSIDKKI